MDMRSLYLDQVELEMTLKTINLSTAIERVHTHLCYMFSKSFYLGVEDHIRDEVSLNCQRVAKDCFIEVVNQWLSYEDGTVWSCKVNMMFMSLSQLTTGNSLLCTDWS